MDAPSDKCFPSVVCFVISVSLSLGMMKSITASPSDLPSIMKVPKVLLPGFAIALVGFIVLWRPGSSLLLRYQARKIAPAEAAMFIVKNLEFYEKHVKVGQIRSQAEAMLPEPNNRDRECVWIWVRDFSPKLSGEKWKELLKWPQSEYFVVVVDGKVATPLCSAAAFDPWEALARYTNLTEDEADQILGQKQ